MPSSIAIAVNPGDPSSLRRITIDVPEPTGEQVLIDVLRCGVCGTDREVIDGHIGGPPGDAEYIVLGHEMLGRVRSVGDDVSGLDPGDLVTATVRRPDGCPLCQAGQPDMCLWDGYIEHGIDGLHGFLSQHVLVDQEWVVAIPAHLEATGTLVEPLTVIEKALRQVHHMQRRLEVWEPRTAVVLGAGSIGILATMVLRSMDIDTWAVARSPGPHAASRAVERTGAHYISTEEESLDELRERLPRIDIVMESTGAGFMSYEAIDLVGKNGIVALLSVPAGDAPIESPADMLNKRLVMGNAVVFGSVNAGREDWETAGQRLDSFEERWPGLAESLITTRIPFNGDISPIAEGGGGIKTVVEFTSPPV
jgi:glucose 1-dehydrogenase